MNPPRRRITLSLHPSTYKSLEALRLAYGFTSSQEMITTLCRLFAHHVHRTEHHRLEAHSLEDLDPYHSIREDFNHFTSYLRTTPNLNPTAPSRYPRKNIENI